MKFGPMEKSVNEVNMISLIRQDEIAAQSYLLKVIKNQIKKDKNVDDLRLALNMRNLFVIIFCMLIIKILLREWCLP